MKYEIDFDDCYAKRQEAEKPDKHCWIEAMCPGWGCRYLRTMGTHEICFVNDYWYTHGKFNRLRTIFYIDKKEITYLLLKEVEDKGIDKCPAFSTQHLLNLIEQLPDKVYVDGKKWTYYDYYDIKLINGKPKKVKMTAVAPLFDDLYNFTDIDNKTMIRNPKK